MLGREADGLHVRDLADRVGFVFQDFEAQLFSTSVEEEVVFGLEQLGADPRTMRRRIEHALAAVGLGGFERRDPTTLSGGEKQRLAIAAVLALEPELWLLDEPSTDLDPAGRRELFALLARLRAAGATFLVVEHDVEAMMAADRWIVIGEGRVALKARPAEVLLGRTNCRGSASGRRIWRSSASDWRCRLAARRGAVAGRSTWRACALARERSIGPASRPRGRVILEARGVRFRYEDQRGEALDGVDFTVREGEIVALIGSNGSGKRRWRGSRRHPGGRGGTDCLARATTRRARRAGACSRGGLRFPESRRSDLRGDGRRRDRVRASADRLPGAETDARVRAVVDAVGLVGLEARDPFLLTKGERQKVAVASILALRPAVLILDEPTTGLDFRELTGLMNVLERLHRAGQTVVIITHVPWVVGTYAERAVLLKQGRVLYDGSVRNLFADEALCRSADFVPPEAARLANRLGSAAVDVEGFLALVE